MSGKGVYDDEMPTNAQPLDDVAVEAFLSGRSIPGTELTPLAAFREDVHAATTAPPPAPLPALAALMTEGISSPQERVRPAMPTKDRRTRMTVSQLFAGSAAKVAALGIAAKASLGAGVAAASIVTAGVAGALPDPAQHAVARVVAATTPFELGDTGVGGIVPDLDVPDVTVPDVTVPDVTVPDVTVPDVTVPDVAMPDLDDVVSGEDGNSAQRKANHGACVSAVARQKPADGSSHGQAVSAAARSDCGKDGVSGSIPTTTLVGTGNGDLLSQQSAGKGTGNGAGNSGGNRGGGNRR